MSPDLFDILYFFEPHVEGSNMNYEGYFLSLGLLWELVYSQF